MMQTPLKNIKYKTVVFDMDGTLVDSKINYTAIYEALNLEPHQSIMKHVNSLDESEKKKALEIVHHFEDEGCRLSTPIPGAFKLLESLNKSSVNTAVFTLNSRITAEKTLKLHNLGIPLLITREDAKPKPDPEGLLKICNHFSTPVSQALYVGDYIYDIQAGINAKIKTALYTPVPPDFDHSGAYLKFSDYQELSDYIFKTKEH